MKIHPYYDGLIFSKIWILSFYLSVHNLVNLIVYLRPGTNQIHFKELLLANNIKFDTQIQIFNPIITFVIFVVKR